MTECCHLGGCSQDSGIGNGYEGDVPQHAALRCRQTLQALRPSGMPHVTGWEVSL